MPVASRQFRLRGFTLIEVIVVVAVLALIASVVVPRMSNLGERRFRLASTEVGDLLTMFAQREMAGESQLAITLQTRPDGIVTMALLTLSVPPDAEPNEAAEWRVDPFVTPIKLPAEVDLTALRLAVDGEELDLTDTPFRHRPGDRRPRIEIELRSPDGRQTAVVALEPYAISPSIRLDGAIEQYGSQRQPIDLDAAGRSREAW